jgi:hypothetical protein
MLLAIYGALAMGHLVAAVIFLRFWSRVHQALLMIFALAFGAMALSYLLLCFVNLGTQEPMSVYLLRLSAFAGIIAGIIWTNVRKRSL